MKVNYIYKTMKKIYFKPETNTVLMESIAAQVNSIQGNGGINYGGGGSGPAHAKAVDFLDVEEDEVLQQAEKEFDMDKWVNLDQFVQK